MNSFLFYTFVFIGQTLVHIATHRGGGNRGHLVLALQARLYIKTHENSDTLDGLNANCVIMDELHSVKDRNLYEVMKQSQSARRQPY